MSVIVMGMEMPKCCRVCDLFIGGACCAKGYRDYSVILYPPKPDNCPLIEVPTPHGRLIDADAHILEIRKQYCEDCSRRKGIKNGKMKFLYEIGGVVCRACEIEDMLNALDDAPTVIEAED